MNLKRELFYFCVILFLSFWNEKSLVTAQICQIIVPQNPLTAEGLATPYIQSNCQQALGQTTFVQAVIIDLDNNVLLNYSPLVIDVGTKVAAPPTPVTLPANNIVGIWFGTNGAGIQLVTSSTTPGMDSLQQGRCVNGGGGGLGYTIFGKAAGCNTQIFWAVIRRLQVANLLKVPPLGVDFNGNACPSTHDFAIVSQNPSAGVTTSYILTNNNQVAQNTNVNTALFNGQGIFNTVLTNFLSDQVIVNKVATAVNCTIWKIRDLTDPTGASSVPTIVTNELQAAQTNSPVALVPLNSPLVLNNGLVDLQKTNSYRLLIGQAPIVNASEAALKPFCQNLYSVGALRLANWIPRTQIAPSQDKVANSLATFLITRFIGTTGPAYFNCTQFFTFAPGTLPPLQGIVNNQGNINLVVPAGSTLAQVIGSSAFTPNPVNDRLDQLNFIVNGTANASPFQTLAAQATATGNGGTTTNTTAFSGMWFGIGIGIGAAVILLLDLMFLFYKNSKIRSNSVNNALARV